MKQLSWELLDGCNRILLAHWGRRVAILGNKLAALGVGLPKPSLPRPFTSTLDQGEVHVHN